jgi:hypothetical protein
VGQGAVTTSLSSGTLSIGAPAQTSLNFSNSNGISFGVNGSTLTASHNGLTSQSVQTQNSVQVLGSSGNISFANGNGVTFGGSNSTVTASVNIPAQTNQTIGVFGSSQTTGQSSSSTYDARSLTVRGAGIVSVGNSGGEIIISATAAGGPGGNDGVNIVAAGSQTANTTGTVAFSNSNNVSFGMSNSSVVTASASFSQSVQTQGMVSVNGSTGAVSISGGNNITVGNNNSTITISAPNQSNQTLGLYGSGNTAGTSSGSVDARSLTINAQGSLTVNMTDGKINISAPNAITTAMASNRGTDFVQANAVFNGTNASGTINSNAVSVSVNAQSVQTQNMVSVLGSTGNISFANGNNVTFGANASTVTASASFNQSNQTVGIYGSSNTSGTSSGTLDARSLTVVGMGGVSVDMTNGRINISGQTTSPQSVQTQNMVSVNGSTGAISISGGNNITVGNNNSTVTISAANQSNQTMGLYASGNTSGTSTGTFDARSLTVNVQGSLTADITNGRLNLSAPNALTTAMASNRGTDFVQANAAFAGTNASGTIASNGLSVSVSNQSNQSVGIYGGGNTSGTSSGTLDARSLSISAQGSLTVNMTNGRINLSAPNALTTAMQSNASTQFVQANANFNGTNASGTIASNNISVSVANQTNQTVGIYGSGNTSGTSSGTLDARSLTVNAQGSLTVNMTDGKINISAPNALTTAMASNRGTDFVQANAAFNGTNASGTIASNAISVSVNAQSVQTQNMVSVLGSTGNISFANGNNVTFGGNASTVTASASFNQTNQTIGIYGSGNTSGTSSGTLDARSLTINVQGSLTADMTNGRINISAPNALTTAMASNRGTDFVQATAAFNGTNASGTIASNAISVSVSNQSNQTIGVYASSQTTGQSSSSTVDARSLTVRGMGNISAGMSGGELVISGAGGGGGINAALSGNTSGVMSTITSGTMILAGGNNITLSQDGQSVTISAPNLGAGNAFYAGVSTGGNTSGGTGTVSQQIVLAGGNNITMSQSVNGNSATLTVSGVSFANSNNISFGLNAGTLTASFNPINIGVSTDGNTAGTTGTLDGGNAQFLFVGGSNVTMSQSINGSSASLSIHAGPRFEFFEPISPLQSGSTTFSQGVSSWYFQPMQLPAYVGPGRLNVLHTMGGTSQTILQGSTGTNYASNTTGGASQSFVLSRIVALYSRGTGTNNTRLESMWAATFPISVSHSVGISVSNASQVTGSRQVDLRYPSQVDISGNSTIATIQATHATSSAGSSVGTSFYTSALSSIYNILSGAVMMHIPITTAISPGNYWLAHGWVTGHTTAGSTLPAVLPTLTAYGIYNSSSYNHRAFGVTAASSGSQYFPGHGVFSVQSAAPPNNVNLRDIRSYASNAIPYFNIMASSIS